MATSKEKFEDNPLFVANLILYLQEGHRAEGVNFDPAYVIDLIAHYHRLQQRVMAPQIIRRLLPAYTQASFYQQLVKEAQSRIKQIIAAVEAGADDLPNLLTEAARTQAVATEAAKQLEILANG